MRLKKNAGPGACGIFWRISSISLGYQILTKNVLQSLFSAILVFKCLGHIYVIDDEFISTQFLVLNKDQAVAVKSGDVIVSAQSHGFIEKVTSVNHTSDMVFVETELERCTENSTWNQRLDFFCVLASTSDYFFKKKPVTCHGII